jgi:uncharacterized integral membrane protein
MRVLVWIVVLPFLVMAAFFAIANRESVTISLWPVLDDIRLPLFLALTLTLYAGFILGAIVAWWSGRTARRRAHDEAQRAENLAAEKRALERTLAEREAKPAGETLPLPGR